MAKNQIFSKDRKIKKKQKLKLRNFADGNPFKKSRSKVIKAIKENSRIKLVRNNNKKIGVNNSLKVIITKIKKHTL